MPLLASPYVGARHRRAPVDTAETEAVQAPPEAAAEPARLPFEPPRLPFEPPRPSGDFPGPPERSHD
jgi:hypothetical protein